MIWAFWICVVLLACNYVGYPLLCMLRARLFPRPWIARQGSARPTVSVIVAVHNESAVIEERIRNACRQTAPPLEVLIGSDGSDDETVVRARAAAAAEAATDVRVFEFPRAGKLATLGRLAPEARGELLVFTDANSVFREDALEKIAAPFTDPCVACAAGTKVVRGGNAQTCEGESTYWTLENRLKKWESDIGSCAGADGALYAIRRSDFPRRLPQRLLADDLYLSLSVTRHGRRCVFVPEAIVCERSDTSAGSELRRKARIFAGAINALLLNWKLLLPGSGLCLALWGHKVLRWFGFLLIAGALAGSTGLWYPFRETFWLGAFSNILMSLIGRLFPATLRIAIVRLPFYFALMNTGQFMGLLEWARNRNQPTWAKLR